MVDGMIKRQEGFAFNEEGFVVNTGNLLLLKKSGQDGDGGRVNVKSGVDNSNNKARIRFSGTKLTDENVGILSRKPLKNMSSSESWDLGGGLTNCFGSLELHV
uniref:Probable pre-mRNA-splicing factor ATP-dependent RNA helicase DEAH5 n=1 Tax=Tanacetum cinerariifolium TaxID=118510 RepID=A0A6L2LIZ0_TANCI|nr:probable pre-mRNA-splicing factor ATP-dependent RNA helicase DEAH5 [Tanacetum cinerariifolium]